MSSAAGLSSAAIREILYPTTHAIFLVAEGNHFVGLPTGQKNLMSTTPGTTAAPYKQIYFEISGICNAKCQWCVTGNRYLNGIKSGSFVDVSRFKESIAYMKAKGLIDGNTCIALYNWGEPFLHPNLNEILEFLYQSRITYSLSTNASKLVTFTDKPVFETLSSITFSMCGFSQESYDKIHKFNFEKIKANIVSILDSLKARGFRGDPQIAFHVYQFNIGEIQAAKAFAAKHRLSIACSLAFINDYERSKQYLNGTTSSEDLRKMSHQLILYPYEEAKTKAPADYKCPQFSCLVLDENCQVEVCCVSSAKLKGITTYEPEALDAAKRTHPICRECRNLNIDYIMHNPVMWDKLTDKKGPLRKIFGKLARKLL